MNTVQYFHEAFQGMTQLGPGSTGSTLKAVRMHPGRQERLSILDIGCGLGTHTFVLAEQFPNSQVTAIDNYAPYIKGLNEQARQNCLEDRIHGIEMSMTKLSFTAESYDLLWAEGTVYIMGFKRALKEWRYLLKPGGYIICNEISWLNSHPSAASLCFWQENYAEIDTIEAKLMQIAAAGYETKTHFICPVTDWSVNYYDPLQRNINTMKEKYADNKEALSTVHALQQEINIYRRCPYDYSYVYFIIKIKKE